MGWLADRYRRFIDECNACETHGVREFTQKQYGRFAPLNVIYPDLRTPSGQAKNAFYFVIITSSLIYQAVIAAMSVVKLFNWRLDACLLIINLLMGVIFAFTFYIAMITHRSCCFRCHEILMLNFYQYSFEMDSNEQMKRYLKLSRRVAQFTPLLISASVMPFILFRPPLKERFVEGIEFTLPVISWSPYSVESWPRYLMASLLQFLTMGEVLVLISLGVFIFFNCTMHIICEIQRLDDSIIGIEARGLFLYEKKMGTPYAESDREALYKTEEFSYCLSFCLRENVIHHLRILKFFASLKTISDPAVLVSFLSFAVMMASCLASLTMEGYLGARLCGFTYGFTILVLASIICVMGQQMIDGSNDLSVSFYSIKWYSVTNKGFIQNLLILFEKLKKPVIPNAFGFISYNLNVLTLIIQTTYSYYNLLRLVQNTE